MFGEVTFGGAKKWRDFGVAGPIVAGRESEDSPVCA
jgi:hypothetical protein